MKMTKFTMSLPEAMNKALEEEKERRKLGTIQETIRSILAEYFKSKGENL
jgi:metal-responsive CopG/Arc/MetJ family transcriptional regulator